MLVFPFGMIPPTPPSEITDGRVKGRGSFGLLLCTPLWFPISTPNLGHSAPCFAELGRSQEHQGNIPGGPGEPRGSAEVGKQGTEGGGHGGNGLAQERPLGIACMAVVPLDSCKP